MEIYPVAFSMGLCLFRLIVDFASGGDEFFRRRDGHKSRVRDGCQDMDSRWLQKNPGGKSEQRSRRTELSSAQQL